MTQLYYDTKNKRYYTTRTECVQCETRITSVCVCMTVTLNSKQAMRHTYCTPCARKSRYAAAKHVMCNIACVLEDQSMMKPGWIVVPVRPCMPRYSNTHTVWSAASGKIDREYNGVGCACEVVDRTVWSGRDQCDRITHNKTQLLGTIKRLDGECNDVQAEQILTARPQHIE